MFNREAVAQLTEALAAVPDGKGRPLGELQASLVVQRTASFLRETGATQAEADEIAKAWLNILENPQATSGTKPEATKELMRDWVSSRYERAHELSIVERNRLGFNAHQYAGFLDLLLDNRHTQY